MNDRAVSLLEQYELEVSHTRKGRGAILCETDQGLMIFKEYGGNPEHLKLQDAYLKFLSQKGEVASERLIPTKEGELFVKDNDGTRYILKTYRDGRECNLHEKSECIEAVRLLARLHLQSQGQEEVLTNIGKEAENHGDPQESQGHAPYEMRPKFSIANEYAKRNRELKRIKKYLLSRGQKTWFELSLLGCFDRFHEQAVEAQEGWASYLGSMGGQSIYALCHGDYQYHNILIDQKGWFLINFERCIWDDPVRDLHLLLRKLLEKNEWSIAFGEELIREYEKLRPLPAISKIDLHYRLAFPEKFWKIANYYYNSGKAWIPDRNLEKLEKLLSQEEKKQAFLESKIWLA